MGCGTCGPGGCSTGGCGQNGGCATGGCNKLNTYDWLGNMLSPDQSEVDNIYEVRFKNTRKGFYRNVNGLRLYIGDNVVVESDRGYDVGTLSLGGVLAELQMKKKGLEKKLKEIPKIYRKANEADLEQLKAVREREHETLVKTREIIEDLKLDMKLSEVEFQGDNSKAIFYYIADHRVDFRELIKVLAREFRIRVEMKQIGLRHEAGLVGGIGSCGRELCCSTWLTEFKTVSTSAARYQNLSLNPMKISGMCGRLKCCLNYELETYMDALIDFPEVSLIQTAKGNARLEKTDIFKRIMWFSYEKENTWYPVNVDKVKEIVAANKKGERPEVELKGVSNFGLMDSPSGEEDFEMVDFVGAADLLEERKNEEHKRKPRQNRGKGRNSNNKRGRRPSNNAQKGNQSDKNKRGNSGGGQDNRGGKKKQGGQNRNPQSKNQQSKNPNSRNNPKNQNPNQKRKNPRRGPNRRKEGNSGAPQGGESDKS
ncbi:MAG: hypothetical protein MRZ79_00870 [Bacteroidia bacterium]|nr:hypothetical protein [Bacteroidia bacterium]